MIAWLAGLAASPLAQKILIPAISDALARVFDRLANRLETKIAVKAAKAAKTSEELRDASKKLTAATRRDP